MSSDASNTPSGNVPPRAQQETRDDLPLRADAPDQTLEFNSDFFPPESSPSHRKTIGRFVITRELGQGGFGKVYLAHDPKLNRKVAIKIPRLEGGSPRLNSFLEEGRSVARLDHPSIVRVYDFEEGNGDEPAFVVMEYVKGPTLRKVITKKGLTFTTSIKYLIQIAEALSYAHSQTLVHRDLKPENVIISAETDQAKLMDFGMALHDLTPEESISRSPEGTPPFMAPEQVRGENHRIDRRTDLWAFGVLMYIMLTGRKPFPQKKISKLVDAICLEDPASLRSRNPDVPPELERICLKCLEKLMNARYQTADQLIDDIRNFEGLWQGRLVNDPTISTGGILAVPSFDSLSKSQSGQSNLSNTNQQSGQSRNNTDSLNQSTVKIIPKGLRSFDAQDADFFVSLLPGPKDRDHVPESLRFWTSKLALGSEDPVSVGLIFGPSGCGKSSFVKAGLLPRLARVKTVFVEATPTETEGRIAAKINKIAPHLDDGKPLSNVFARLRRGQLLTGEKLLVVIDQFEQWLNGRTEMRNQELLKALRHCDGENLCCLLMVRDDFWLSATEVMAQLDLKVQEGVNALGIPLFDRKHARKVLTAYGQANEAFGEKLTNKQVDFVSDAVSEMSEKGRIIPVHLALFSQMMDSDSWEASQLKKLGGWKGLGVHFLESSFADKRTSRFESACRPILQQLVPKSGSQIKGARRTFRQLLDAMPDRDPTRLTEALEFLDRNLRIITPTESESNSVEVQQFQLTHDYLVTPIRDWLSKKEKETREGRAQMRLRDLAEQWESEKKSRFLPGPLEYVTIAALTKKRNRSTNEKSLLTASSRYYAVRAIIAIGAIAICSLIALSFSNSATKRHIAEKFQSLLIGGPEEVDFRIRMLQSYPEELVQNVIAETEFNSDRSHRENLHTLFAQARFSNPAEFPIQSLIDQIPKSENNECANFVRALQPFLDTDRKTDLLTALKSSFQQLTNHRSKSRLAILALYLDEPELAQQQLACTPDPEARLAFVDCFVQWHEKIDSLLDLIVTNGDREFQSGMCLAFGQIDPRSLGPNTLKHVSQSIEKLMKTTEDAAVHSSARWMLERYGINPKLDRLRSPDSSWFVKNFDQSKTANHELVTFIRIQPHAVFQGFGLNPNDKRQFHRLGEEKEINLDYSFHISAREIPASLFFKFMDSLSSDDPTRIQLEKKSRNLRELPDDFPINGLSWFEAAMFCNWLSKKDRLQPCYYKTDKVLKATAQGDLFEWARDRNCNGYRLPTPIEWEAAHRGNTKTRYSFGKSLSRLSQHAITSIHEGLDSKFKVGSRGLKMPNNFGIFDTVGNASEWCDEPFDLPERMLRGGNSTEMTKYFQSSAYYSLRIHEPDYATANFASGLRIVVDYD